MNCSTEVARHRTYGTALIVAASVAFLTSCGSAAPSVNTPTGPAFVFGRQVVDLAVGVAVHGQASSTVVETTVLNQDGSPGKGLELAVAANTEAFVPADSCGEGVYCAALGDSVAGGRVRVSVKRSNGSTSVISSPVPADPKHTIANEILTSSNAELRSLSSLRIIERLGAGPPYPILHTVFNIAAPDKLSYRTLGDGQAVIIGGTRWDRASIKDPWQESNQEPLDLPGPEWNKALDASILGEGTFQGRPVWFITFYDPTVPAWYEAAIDRDSHQLYETSMTGAAHFMLRHYGDFNEPITVEAPK